MKYPFLLIPEDYNFTMRVDDNGWWWHCSPGGKPKVPGKYFQTKKEAIMHFIHTLKTISNMEHYRSYRYRS